MKRKIILTLFTVILSAGFSYGKNATAREIMEKNDIQMKVVDEQAQFTMKLINKRGKERQRKVVLYSKTDENENDKSLIRFLAPADVKGVGLLSIEDGEREDQWLYLPALKRVRRISSSEKTDSFMGSDFSYEDIEQNDLDDYEYKYLREETIDGIECFVIQSTPVNDQVKGETAYSKTVVWIGKDNFITVKVDFFNKKGDLMKVMKSSDIRRINGLDKWRPYFIEILNLKTGHHTELIYEDIRINQGVADKYFSQRYLERSR